jgi:hypothetical protein
MSKIMKKIKHVTKTKNTKQKRARKTLLDAPNGTT